MLDIDFIRKNPELVKDAARKKRIDFSVEELLSLDSTRREVIVKIDNLRALRNSLSKDIPKLSADNREQAKSRVRSIKEELDSLEIKLKEIEDSYNKLLLRVPNLPAHDVPDGKDENDNVEIKKWGDLPKFDFKPQDHVQLGSSLNILDIPRGVKLSGSRYYFLKNEGALLELAVLRFAIDSMLARGFTLFIPPTLVKDMAMYGTAYFPGGEEQAYKIETDSLNLIGTSEVPITSYHADETINEEDLPKYYLGMSSCYRREAGTYGKDTYGIYRIHEFRKVEQVVILKNDETESRKMHECMLTYSEEILQALKLPYRVVNICTGELGQGQVKKYDIETWMPSRNNYGETHSASMFFDFQARRLNLKYKTKEGKIKFCHTLNNTVIASPRILIPLLEIYQNKDGSVNVPEVLQKYMGNIKIIKPNQ
jgi:seryl-tRNA synthetase